MVRLNDYCDTTEAAAILGCTTARVRQLRQAGAFGGEDKLLPVGGQMLLMPRKNVERYAKKSVTLGRPRKFSA